MFSRLHAHEKGSVIVEFAIVLVPFFALVFGSIFWGIFLWERNSMEFISFQAARCSILPPAPGQANALCGANNKQSPIQYAQEMASALAQSQIAIGASPYTSCNVGSGCSGSCFSISAKSGLPQLSFPGVFVFNDLALTPKTCFPTQ